MKNLLLVAISLAIISARSLGQSSPSPAERSVEKLVQMVTAQPGTTLEKTQWLVSWLNTNLNWTATDRVKRSPEEILQRGGGNCFELAAVLEKVCESAKIKCRWIAEINLQPESSGREGSAKELIREIGAKGSVFGLRHNDHRWLEVYDEETKTWFPADPAAGLVGIRPWIEARMSLGDRPVPRIPAVAEVMQDMIVPFTIIALPTRNATEGENRSSHYLVEEFNHYYNDKLSTLPSWPGWVQLIDQLSQSGALAFSGKADLHEEDDAIACLETVYRQLKVEANEHSLRTASHR